MKKFLLSLLALLSFSVLSFGAVSITEDEVISELTFPDYNDNKVGSYTAEWTATKDELTWTFNAFNNNNSGWAFIRCGRKNNESTATILSPQVVNGKATKLVITLDKTNNVSSVTVTPCKNGEALTSLNLLSENWAAGEVTLGIPERYDADQILVTIANSSAEANGPTQISKLVLYGTAGEAPAVETPVLTPSTSTVFGDQTFTITCATEGAKIYYRKAINYEEAMEADKDYSEYTGPFTIKSDGGLFGKTVNAIITTYAVIPATEDAAEQRSQTREVTITWGTIYTSIAELNEAAVEAGTNGKAAAIVADEYLVTYVNGQYNYLTDGVSGLLLYGNTDLEVGQKVSGTIYGRAKSYNGLPEMDQLNLDELEVMSEGNEVAPIVVAASKLQADKLKWVNMFVTVTAAVSMDGPLDVAEGSSVANYNFGSTGTEFIVRNNFKIGITTKDVTMYDVTGFWAIYNDNGQMYPTAVTEYIDPIDVMGDVTSYYIQNPSFDLDEDGLPLTAEQKASNGALDIVGWTMSGVGTQFNNTEIRQANSTSTSSAFGTSNPSDGPYSLFFRQGWNRDGNVTEVTLETEAFELPEGQYIISVDYKQAYSYDKAGSKDTKIKLSLVYDDLNFGEAETEAAPVGNATYFNDTEWSTLEVPVNVDFGDIDLAGSVSPILKITLYAAGDKRSDFFLDNVRIVRVSEEDISRMYLEDAINQATEMLEEPFGQLFTKVESAHSDLQASVEAAQDVYDDEAATAEEIDQAARDLLTAMETYEGSDMILPDPDKTYSIKLKEGGNCYMNVSDAGTKLAEEPIALKFASTDLGWAISNADASYYAALTGTGSNVWSMGSATEAYDWYIEVLPTGEYTIAKASNNAHMIGINSDAALAAETPCYCDKSVAGVGDRAIWIIEEYVEPLENPAEVVTVNTARGAWMYDEANNRMHYATMPEEVTDAFKFSFVEKDGKKFLYSLGAKKFIQPQKYFIEGLTTPITIVDGDGYKMVKAANSNLTINIGGSQFTWDTWTAADDGNKLTIEEVGQFDATEALAMLENTPLDQHKVYTVVTKRGQWAASADHKSLSTTGANTEATDADKQFAFYYDGSDIYIYSVGAKKFFKNDGTLFASQGDAVDYRIVAPLNNNDYDHCFFFTSNNVYFNMQGNGTTYAMNTWNIPDDGNRQKLTVVDVDVYDEMKAVFESQPIDVTYEVYWNDKKVAEATAKHLPGDEVQIPADLDRGLCTLETDIDEITAETTTVKVTATWNGLFEFSESFDEAVWYNMDIRSGWQVSLCEAEPYTMKNDPTEEELASPEFQWAFAGDPYNLVIYNRALSASWSLNPVDIEDGTHCVAMREGDYGWEPFANSDGFVLREKGTLNGWINQSGGGKPECPLSFWSGGRTDDGSTFRVVKVEEPAETLELTIDVERPTGLGYEATTATVDFAEALEFLGVEEISIDNLCFVSTDGTMTSWAEYDKAIDGWCNAEGDMESWGANAFVCAKFFQAIPDGEFTICDMGGDNGAVAPAVGDEFSCKWALKVDNKVVVYTINVTFVEPPAKYLADYTEKGSFDVTIYAPEKGEAFDGEQSEAFEEAAVSELIGEMWGDIYGKGVTDEVGETFATSYTAEPQPGFWFLEDGIADTEENGVFSVSLIPAEDWSTFTFQASTKEAIENNLTTTFYLVNEETKEYVAYNITLSAKPAVNLVGEFDGFIKQILSHPQTGKQGEASGEQTVTIAEGEEEGTYDVTFSGFTMPITGAELPEFTITGVEAEISEDGTSANYVLPAWAPQTITIDRGTGTVTYKIAFEGTKDGNDTPVLKLTLDNSVIDDVYFGADEKTVDKAIAIDEATGINGINSLETAGNVFDLSGRKVQKVQKSGIYIVNGKKVSIK